MNVIISNQQQAMLAQLDIDVIKTLNGEFAADELVDMFKNFFFGRMILDITAIKDYDDIANLQKISMNLDVDKIILVLPNDPSMSASNFLSKVISMGIYNFTTNLEGIRYLMDHPNTYRDVAHIQQLNEVSTTVVDKVSSGTRIIGIKNVTDHAGSTTFIYMLKKELEQSYGMHVVALELGRKDFSFFNTQNMLSTTKEELPTAILKAKDADVILIDLNDEEDDGTCGDVLYLIEPTSIKLNKLMSFDRRIFEKLKGKKIILNKSLLSNSDIMDFEYESKSKVFYHVPPLNDREKTNTFKDLLVKLSIVTPEKDGKDDKNKILGLFKF